MDDAEVMVVASVPRGIEFPNPAASLGPKPDCVRIPVPNLAGVIGNSAAWLEIVLLPWDLASSEE